MKIPVSKLNNCKGQLFSWDLVVSAMIFIFIFLTIAVIWDNRGIEFQENEPKKDIELYSRYAVEALLTTPGYPEDWYEFDTLNSSEINSIGFKDGRYGFIDYRKVQQLMESNESYDEIKKLLGFRGPGYEFSLDIFVYSEERIQEDKLKLGFEGKCSTSLVIKRLARDYEGRLYKLKFEGCIAK
ncbi:MAG: hypothetical protein ACOCZ6_04515 [Nanoarchaeota archaeon]